MRPATRIIFAETIANPTTAVADIKRLAEIAHERGALLVIDSTLAPPVICLPLEHGADLVVHSATKYIGGHSDVTGGVVTGALELITQIRATRIDTGGSLSPDDAFQLRRGLETLPVRVRRQCATASVFAATLAKHPAVAYVDYPGLPTHPGHELARRMFDAGPEGVRFGAIVTVTPYGGREAGLAFASRLRLAAAATSLGGTHTVVSHVASTTHRQLDDRALAAAGIDAGAVRFSIGLEDVGGPDQRRLPGPGEPRPRPAGSIGMKTVQRSSGGGAWARRARSGSPWCSGGAARARGVVRQRGAHPRWPSTGSGTTSCRSASPATGGGC